MVFLARARQPVFWVVVTLSLLTAALAFSYTYTKYCALGFDAVDYSFYAQSVATLAHPDQSQQLNINPNGHNAFRFEGTEAVRSVNQAIHFEPVKYIEAVLYAIFPSILILFLFFAIVSVSPILYLACVAPLGGLLERKKFALISFIYLAQPLLIISVANDLRPLTLLTPIFFGVFLSLYYDRPLWEQGLWFGALFLVREEAVILVAVLLCFAFCRKYRLQKARLFSSIKEVWQLVCIWFLGTCVTAWYYVRVDYSFALSKTLALHAWILPAVFLLVVGVLITSARFFWHIVLRGQIVSLALLFGIVSAELYFTIGASLSARAFGLVSHPFSWLFWVLILCIGILLYEEYPHVRKGVIIAATSCTLLLLVFGSQLNFGLLQQYVAQEKNTAFLWQLTQRLPPTVPILVDMQTVQVFYSFDRVYAFERLPVYLAGVDGRYYPVNSSLLQKLLKEQVRFVVIANTNIDTIQKLVGMAGKHFVLLAKNDQYSFWSVE